jgi:predicted O-methyltransferase YrrM
MDALNYILNKYNLKLSRVIEIPDVGRDNLASLLAELSFKTGVEIGVERGFYSKVLCKANPQMKIYGIDPWVSLAEEKENSPDRRTENTTSQHNCDLIYKDAVNRLKIYPKYRIIKEYSIDALTRFEDGSLDFVYIDGNHQDYYVLKDIEMWSRKVRKGGIVSGHDYYNMKSTTYGHLEVKKVVDAYVTAHKISPLIIWGLKNSLNRDKYRSWMWIA